MTYQDDHNAPQPALEQPSLEDALCTAPSLEAAGVVTDLAEGRDYGDEQQEEAGR